MTDTAGQKSLTSTWSVQDPQARLRDDQRLIGCTRMRPALCTPFLLFARADSRSSILAALTDRQIESALLSESYIVYAADNVQVTFRIL